MKSVNVRKAGRTGRKPLNEKASLLNLDSMRLQCLAILSQIEGGIV